MNKQPNLQGLRVLNTRPMEQGKQLSQAIRDAGGVCIQLPAFTIEPTPESWLNEVPDLLKVQHAIFISPNAVNYFFKSLKHRHITWPQSISVIAIGKATATTLINLGVKVDNIPLVADSEHLLQLDTLQQVRDQTLLLVKGVGGLSIIEDSINARGADLKCVAVYRRSQPIIAEDVLTTLWRDNKVDIILFTSQQGMYTIFNLFGEQARDWLCNKTCLVISERLAKEAALLGIKTILISSYDSVLDSLDNYIQGLRYDT